jgi:hypothetical protein
MPSLGSKTADPSFFRRRRRMRGWAEMAKRIVESTTEAHQGTTEGVVRNVLLASLVLVVVLFIVAYGLFS